MGIGVIHMISRFGDVWDMRYQITRLRVIAYGRSFRLQKISKISGVPAAVIALRILTGFPEKISAFAPERTSEIEMQKLSEKYNLVTFRSAISISHCSTAHIGCVKCCPAESHDLCYHGSNCD